MARYLRGSCPPPHQRVPDVKHDACLCSPRYSAADVSKALQQVRPCLGEVVPQEK